MEPLQQVQAVRDDLGDDRAAQAPAGEKPGEAAWRAMTDIREALSGDLVSSEFWQYAPLGIALFDRECRYVRINAHLAAVNGLSVEAHLNRTLEEVLPHLAPLIRPLLRHVLDTGEPVVNNEMRGEIADGTGVRHWLATYYPIRNEAGQIIGAGVLVIESTQLDRAEAALLDKTRALQEANFRLELLSRASAVLSSSLDIETTLQSVAQMAVPAFADWCLVDLIEPDGSLRRVAAAHADACKSDVASAFQTLHLHPAPEAPLKSHGIARVLRTGEPDVVPLVTEDILHELAIDDSHAAMLHGLEMTSYISVPLTARGCTLGVLNFAVCGRRRSLDQEDLALARELASRAGFAIDNARLYRDATEARKRAEAERERAQAAARAKDEFFSILSHELRTPLTSACGWMQLHRGGKLDAETQLYALETVERALAVQVRLVNELLDSSRLAAGRMTLEAAPVALAPLIADTLANLEPAATAKDMVFESALGDVRVRGEAGRLQQIVWNLVANAVKFSPPGSTVRISLDRFENSARVVVIDSGPGIAPDFLQQVFEPFRQAEISFTRAHGGLGLGLPVARALAEMHGGTLEARSAGADQGAVFTLTLPLLDHGAYGEADGRPGGPRAGAEAGVPSDKALLAGLRVLLVEDDDDARGWMRIVLRAQGADVAVAATLRQGLDQFFQYAPDVLVSDISLPDGDGYTLIERIRDSEATAHGTTYGARRAVPAIALTARTMTTDRLRALAAGFQLHIPKPVSPDELLLTVAALAGRSISGRL